jgi:glycosyltransferase involved in cell wall biosynthesis
MSELASRYLDRVRAIVHSGGASLLVLRIIWTVQLLIQDKYYRMRTLHGYHLKKWIDNKGNKELLKKARANPGPHSSSEPLVSVIIPTYNRAHILCERTIPSVLKQTYRNFELIVIGDHCTDNTRELIDRFRDKRIRFLNLEKRGEYPRNSHDRWMVAGSVPRNRGLELAHGGWIAPLDDDDEFSNDHLELLLHHALQNQYDMVYGILQMEVGPGKWAACGSYPLSYTHICHSAVLYSSVLKFLKYDVNAWKYAEADDWNLWRRMKEAGAKIGFLDKVVGKHYQEFLRLGV